MLVYGQRRAKGLDGAVVLMKNRLNAPLNGAGNRRSFRDSALAPVQHERTARWQRRRRHRVGSACIYCRVKQPDFRIVSSLVPGPEPAGCVAAVLLTSGTRVARCGRIKLLKSTVYIPPSPPPSPCLTTAPLDVRARDDAHRFPGRYRCFTAFFFFLIDRFVR